ncbi:hypothetical protein ACG92U_12020 [Leuconostoc citreum]
MSATQTVATSSGTIAKIIANDNKLPDDSQPKDTINALFNAGYVSDKQVLSEVSNDKVGKFVKQFLGQLESDPVQAKNGMSRIINCNLANKKTAYYFLGL